MPASPSPLEADTTLALLRHAKQLFRRASEPSRLVGRDQEHQVIRQFLLDHAVQNQPGSLYISGQPGTGKTASLLALTMRCKAQFLQAGHPIKFIIINCMTIDHPQHFYARLATDIVGKPVAAKDALKVLEALFLDPKRKTLCLVVLDEIDSLLTRDQSVLYKLFEWPTLPHSRLTLIGIANALDLTDRFLPRLKAKQCMPQLLNFNPYQVPEIAAIIQDRLQEVYSSFALPTNTPDHSSTPAVPPTPKRRGRGQSGKTDSATDLTIDGLTAPLAGLSLKDAPPLIETPAVELCARKVAAATGDLRRALDICRQAIEAAETQHLAQIESAGASQDTPAAPVLPMKPPANSLVTIVHMLKVLQTAFGTPTVAKIHGLNFQQKLVLVTAALYLHGKRTRAALTLGKLHDAYVAQCKATTVVSPVSRLEFFDLVTTLESFGLVTIGSARTELNRKITLPVQVSELCHAVTDVPIIQQLIVPLTEESV
ncbi:AAA ATPase [Dimargaris verticillata]|uniref:Cell division control protein n=1 Tax=Dimargaris verticillata TaxID=2761393 RepID=A0A9W8EB09_9FUNG|nr:AAA ATPase [Dimargaris verticillata]